MSRVSAEYWLPTVQGGEPSSFSAKSRTRLLRRKGEAHAAWAVYANQPVEAKLMLTALLDALPYLVDYPYGCVEQTMSRFLPAIAVRKTLADSGFDAAAVERRILPRESKADAARREKTAGLGRLDEVVQKSLSRARSMQRPLVTSSSIAMKRAQPSPPLGAPAGRWRRPSLDRPSSAPCCCAISRTESNA